MDRLFMVSLAAVFASLCASCGARDPFDTKWATRDFEPGFAKEKRPGVTAAYEHLVRGRVLGYRGDSKEAAVELRIAVASDPEDFLLRVEYAEILLDLEEYERARHQIAKAVLLEPGAQAAWVVLAKTYALEGRDEKAVDAARHGLRVEPDCPEAGLWLASFYMDRGEKGAAAELYDGVLDTHPRNAEALLGLGLASAAIGNRERARESLEAYSSLAGNSPEAAVALAEERLAAGDAAGAIAMYEAALVADSDPVVRGELIALLLSRDLRRRALEHIRSLPPLSPGDADEAVLRAKWLALAGRPYEARETLLTSWEEAPDAPSLKLALARIELTLGRIEIADLLLRDQAMWPEALADEAREVAAGISNALEMERTVR